MKEQLSLQHNLWRDSVGYITTSYIFCSSHSHKDSKPPSDVPFSSGPGEVVAREVPKNEISPPSHSSNLKDEPSFSPHSSPPMSERSPSSPSPSMLIPPL